MFIGDVTGNPFLLGYKGYSSSYMAMKSSYLTTAMYSLSFLHSPLLAAPVLSAGMRVDH
jgi:hypothetical protein